MLRYLLDTNIVIYVIKRRPIEALEIFNENAGRVAISSITLAELMHGAEKSSKPPANLAVVEDFCSRLEVLAYGGQGRPALWLDTGGAGTARPDHRRQ